MIKEPKLLSRLFVDRFRSQSFDTLDWQGLWGGRYKNAAALLETSALARHHAKKVLEYFA